MAAYQIASLFVLTELWMQMFNQVGANYAAVFTKDRISNLIVRLRHNVIKAGLRMINISYSKFYSGRIHVR